MSLTQGAWATAMGVERKLVNELCNNRSAVTADTALMLARVFGNSPDFWLNVQRRTDLWEALHTPKRRQRIEQARALLPLDSSYVEKTMVKKNVQGICKLCLQDRELQKSHYLPKALYRLCRSDGKNPIVATSTVVEFSQKQMWKPLLCKECEDLLNKRGEKYTLEMVHRGDRFSLLERIKLATQIGQSGNVPFYSGLQLGIETEKLGYFALSLAWRGAQGPWQTIQGHTTEVSLGQFEEPIRQYLHDDSSWPGSTVVIATTCTDFGSKNWITPPWLNPADVAGGDFVRIELLIRGLWFWVLMGQIPEQIAALCCVNSPQQIIFLRDCEDQLLLLNRHFLESAEDRTSISHLH